MKHLFTLFFILSLFFISQLTNAQIKVYKGSDDINELSFCSSPTATLSVELNESKNGGGTLVNYFPSATGNIIL